MRLRTVRATRYVTPLREGGSLPAIVEADDQGLYVVKFRGAGQGPLALVAELIGGEIGRLLSVRVPEIVLIEVDAALGRNEPDTEIRELLTASSGLNLALDFLPGSVMFDPAAGEAADAETASKIVWFDSFISNVDRTAYNANLLCWHKAIYCIDHGAALYFHHDWESRNPAAPFVAIRKHVLLRWASRIAEADAALRPLLNNDALSSILANVPPEWLPAEEWREGYLAYFRSRLAGDAKFLEEAIRGHAELV